MLHDLHPVPLSQLIRPISRCLKAQIPFIVHGDPGIAKSAIFKKIAAKASLEYIKIDLPTKNREDFDGLMSFNEDKTQANFVPFDFFPLEDTKLPDGCKGWLLNLDELPNATLDVLKASYRVLSDREVGNGKKLHPKVYLAATGNFVGNNTGAALLPPPLLSRLSHFHAISDYDDYMKNVAPSLNPLVRDYLADNGKGSLNNFKAVTDTELFACERTWSTLGKYLDAAGLRSFEDIQKKGMPDSFEFTGIVGKAAGSDFKYFIESLAHRPTVHGIVTGNFDPTFIHSMGNASAKGRLLEDAIKVVGNAPNKKELADGMDNLISFNTASCTYPETRSIVGHVFDIFNANKQTLNTSDVIEIQEYLTAKLRE